jgi:hypothetical protein
MKNQFFLISLCCLLFTACTNSNEQKVEIPTNDTAQVVASNTTEKILTTPEIEQVIPPFKSELPNGYELIQEASGDLNKDKIEEKVLVANTDREGDFGTERDVFIYKIENTEWKLWHRSTGAVLPSDHGGMMGDPFENVSVENGAIVFSHFGGSRQKWAYTHRFRFQNDTWELIGLTNENIATCEETEKFDYNLSSGNVVYKKDYESCEDGDEITIVKTENENFVSKPIVLPIMDGFSFDKPIYAINPKSGNCYPPSACYDYDNVNN